MSKVTSKLQVTVPKAIADQYGIRPGTELHWTPAGDSLRVATEDLAQPAVDRAERLRLFDAATARQRKRAAPSKRTPKDRGWRREDLYDRGLPR